MKPVDKFGNPIYSRTYRTLLEIGRKLETIGFRESFTKPNLFYRKMPIEVDDVERDVSFYADMRGTDIVKIWEDPVPMVYLDGRGLPQWLQKRLLGSEVQRLEASNIPHRFSFFHGENDFFEALDRSRNVSREFEDFMQHALYQLFEEEDGFCKACGRDFQAGGLWCSDECREKLRTKLYSEHVETLEREISGLELCAICRTKISSNTSLFEARERFGLQEVRESVEHHLSYEEDSTIMICTSCHARIHLSDEPEMEPYRPVDEKPAKSRKYRLVPCKGCDRKARVPVDDERATALCYRCKRKEDARQRRKVQRSRYHRGFGGTGTYSDQQALRDKFSG
ncbi:MAG: hypothetical protein ACFFER_20305 [Candidatus Thorarchaeota archaeon]